MRLVKPLYGQPDAPRAWYMAPKRRLEHIGFQVHALDGCLFRLYSQQYQLIARLHVDDMLITCDESSAQFQKARHELREQFPFKHWKPYVDGKPLEFCGCVLDKKDGVWMLHQAPYIKKIHPLTVPQQRSEESPVGAKEISSLRGLLGGLKWPSTQTCQHLSASISLLQGETSKATIGTLRQANKTLKFAKENADLSLQYPKLCKPEDAVKVAMLHGGFVKIFKVKEGI